MTMLLIPFLNIEVQEHDEEHTAMEHNYIAEHLNNNRSEIQD